MKNVARANSRAIATYHVIHQYMRENGFAPTLEEIRVRIGGMPARNSVYRWVKRLEKWGWLSYDGARAMRLTRPTECIVEVPRHDRD